MTVRFSSPPSFARVPLFLLAVLVGSVSSAAQDSGAFQRLGTTPTGGTTLVFEASADGDVLVGPTFVWDAGAFVDLPEGFLPRTVDADGSLISGQMDCDTAGSTYSIAPACPVTFDRETGVVRVLDQYARTFSPPVVVITPIDTIFVRGATGESAFRIVGMNGVSDDGRTVLGTFELNRTVDTDRDNLVTRSTFVIPGIWRGGEPLLFSCVPGTNEPFGQTEDQDTPDESVRNHCQATGISADGFVISGSQRQNSNTFARAVVWNGGGSASPLGLAEGFECSGAADISGDGSTVVGSVSQLSSFGFCDGDARPVIWVDGQAELLPFPEDAGYFAGSTVDASYDGSVIAGNYSFLLDSGFQAAEAFVWTRQSGVVLLRALLQDSGVNLSEWTSLSIQAIADDGTWVAGIGLNPDGQTEGFRARVPSGFGSASITVTVTGDESDLNIGDGICDVDGATAGEQCTLRAALEESQARIGDEEITFDLPAGESTTIRIGSELPVIEETVTIDARPSVSSTTTTAVVVAEPSYVGDAFQIAGDSSVVRGLSVGGFQGWAFRISGDHNEIYQNAIGVGPNGDPAPNRLGGVLIEGGSGNRVGALGTGNVIAYNGGGSAPDAPGIAVTGTGIGNLIRGNALVGNAGLGIDLGNDGVTPNDPDDEDGGPNGLQNAPRFLLATTYRTVATLDGPEALLDLYVSPTCDPSGFGEGATPIGPGGLVRGDDGTPTYEWAGTIEEGAYVTATATAGGSTGEFGPCIRVAASEDVTTGPLGPDDPTLDGPDLSVTYTAPATAQLGPEAGEAYLLLYRRAPEGNTFDGSAQSDAGVAVTPDAVALSRYWRVGVVSAEGSLAACLSLDGINGIEDPALLLVGQRADPSAPWTPLDSHLESAGDETRLCAEGLALDGEVGILADSETNSVSTEEEPASALRLRAFPNPARRAVTIEATVPMAGHATVEVFDTLGRRIATLHDGPVAAGTHPLALDAAALPAGVYVARIVTPGGTASQPITVVR